MPVSVKELLTYFPSNISPFWNPLFAWNSRDIWRQIELLWRRRRRKRKRGEAADFGKKQPWTLHQQPKHFKRNVLICINSQNISREMWSMKCLWETWSIWEMFQCASNRNEWGWTLHNLFWREIWSLSEMFGWTVH